MKCYTAIKNNEIDQYVLIWTNVQDLLKGKLPDDIVE